MLKRSALLPFFLAIFSFISITQAQQPVTTTSGGSSGTVPVFTTGTNVENSPISVSGSNVGIGTTSPNSPLQVGSPSTYINFANVANFFASYDGDVMQIGRGGQAYGQALQFSVYNNGNYSSLQSVVNGGGYTPLVLNPNGGNVGIGTTSPPSLFDVFGSASFGVPSYGGNGLGTDGKFQILTGGAPPTANRLVFGTDNSGWKMAISKNAAGTITDLMTIKDNGYVGIGTTTPAYPLDVAGQVRSSSGGFIFPDGSSQTTAYTAYAAALDSVLSQSNGSIGIGTASPAGIFQIFEPTGNGSNWINFYNNVGANDGNPPASMNRGMLFGWNPSGGTGEYEMLYGTGLGGAPRLDIGRWNGTTKNIDLSLNNGNVGIGTTNPGAKLEVSGSVKLTAGSGGSITFQDGTTQSTAYTGTTCGGDYAESVDVTGDRKHYEPGDLLVIDPDAPGKFLKSAEPYSTLVAGIYSTKPGTVGRRQLTPKSPDEVPMAMMGIVPTKVTAENGAIKTGDLLVSSSQVGYAMKGTDRSKLTGAVIGKALAGLDSGTGTIEVLVTLQ